VRAGFSVEDFADTQPWLARVLLFAAGALTMLSFAPADIWPLALVSAAIVIHTFRSCRPRQAAQLGFAYGAGLFLTGTYWLYISIHVFGQAPLVLAIFLMVALVIIMAFYYAGAGWLISRCRELSPAWFVVVAPCIWAALEWLRGWFLSGFPWMTLGYSQVDSPLAGFAPVVGIYGISLALMLSAAALVVLVAGGAGKSRYLYAAIVLLPWLAGLGLNRVEWTDVSGPAVRTTIVQGGISQDRKWVREQFQDTMALYGQSLRDNPDSELIVWPEVAIPAVLDQVGGFVELFEQQVAANESTLLFGILERSDDRESVYNSVVSTDGERRQIYRKRHLVPFGEYFPVPDFIREWMRMMNLPYSDISAGDDVQPLLEMPDGNRLSVAICYEDAYAAEQLYALPEATILINISNDAWFGDSIAPHQHLQIARMRAKEAERYVVRSTNNGVSAFIGPDGALLETGPQFEFVSMTRDIEPRSGSTPYASTGNLWVVLFSIIVPVAAFYRHRLRKIQ
jgi:apolipoprotein N-acyltransferase